MFRQEQYDVLQNRSLECERMSLTAKGTSIKQKFVKLAVEYRGMAERIKQLDLMETRLKQRRSAIGKLRRGGPDGDFVQPAARSAFEDRPHHSQDGVGVGEAPARNSHL